MAAAASTAPAAPRFHPTDRAWTLLPDATQTFAVAIEQLGPRGGGSLAPCWGFEITGPDIDYAAGDLDYYGATVPEPGREQTRDGGVPGAERQPDGTFEVPESNAKVTPRQLQAGDLCQKAGWDWLGRDGEVKPVFRKLTRRSRKARAVRQRRLARQASALPFTVELAGVHHLVDGTSELVLRVRTREIPAGTTVRAHARVVLGSTTAG